MPPFVTIRALASAPAAAESAGEQPLVVAELVVAAAVRARGVEHGDARLGGGRDRLERELLVAVLVRRQAHAAETDAELRGGKPSRATQDTEGSHAAQASARPRLRRDRR